MDTGRRDDAWYRSWMTGPAKLQVENRKKEAAELYAALTPSSEVSYDAQTLQDLIHILNHEFLCHKLHVVQETAPDTSLFDASDFPIALPKEWATGLLGILSSCLVKSISPTAYRERELQCRALLTTIALLLAQKVEALQNDFHNGFHQSLSRRFEDLVWQPGPTGDLTQSKFCKVQCSYLLAAAEEYSCRFRRAEPLLLTVSSRIISLLSFGFSVTSSAFGGGGFNLQTALTQLSDGLSEISRKPDRHYEAMFNIQEIAILVNALQVYQGVVKSIPGKTPLAEAASNCAVNLGTTTLDAVASIISDNDGYESNVTPPPEFWQKYVLAPLHRGPPNFNTYYYLYGVVDCAAQIGKVLDTPSLAAQLGNRLKKAVIEASEATHRWKALEYLLSVESNHLALERALQNSTTPDVKKRLQYEFEYILSAVRGEVASYPMSISMPSTGTDAKKRHRTIISPSSCNEKTGPGYATPKVKNSCEQLSIRSSEFPTKHVVAAGLSPDCRAAFALTADKAVVVSLSNLDSRDEQPMLAKQQKSETDLYDAVLSNKYLATITNKELRVTAYRHVESTIGDLVGTEPLGKTSDGFSWVPYTLAIHDARRRTWIAVAGETTTKGTSCGIVEIFEIYGSGTKGVLRRHNNTFTQASREFLKGSSIQTVIFSPNGGRLVCITNDNRILIWLLSNNLRPRNAPFMIRQKFTEGPGVAGLTSATIFQGPSAKNYVLGTTWPSLERHINGGEWSFVSPIASSPADIPKRIFHKLKDLGDAGPIVAGAASPRGEMIALWEMNGQITILPLEGNDDGGLKSRELVELSQKKKSAFRLNRTSPSSIRFRHAEVGLELFALGRTGTILRKHFEGFDNKAMQSPRPSVVAGIAEGDDYFSTLALRQSLSSDSRGDASSAIHTERSRLDAQSISQNGEINPDYERALINETIGKVPALSFTDELSVTSQLILLRTDCPNDSLWRRTSARFQEDAGEQPIHDYYGAFQTYLEFSEDVELEMAQYTVSRDVLRNEPSLNSTWTFRPPRTPSMDSHSTSAREIYAWLWYLQDLHARTMAGTQLLQDENLIEGFINLIAMREPEAKVARLLPISLELLDAITENILRGLDIMKPHLDDPREMGLMEIFDALSPFKHLLDSISGPFGLFHQKAADNENEETDSALPTAEELERFRLLTEMILLSVMSYPGSHATDFPQRHLGAKCEEFRMFTREYSVSFKKRSIGCLREFVKGPLWVFSFQDPLGNKTEQAVAGGPKGGDLSLSSSIADFADLWGRVSLEYPVKGEPEVTEIDWPGGTIRALPNESTGQVVTVANEVLCHTLPWSNEVRKDVADISFDSRRRILVQ